MAKNRASQHSINSSPWSTCRLAEVCVGQRDEDIAKPLLGSLVAAANFDPASDGAGKAADLAGCERVRACGGTHFVEEHQWDPTPYHPYPSGSEHHTEQLTVSSKPNLNENHEHREDGETHDRGEYLYHRRGHSEVGTAKRWQLQVHRPASVKVRFME